MRHICQVQDTDDKRSCCFLVSQVPKAWKVQCVLLYRRSEHSKSHLSQIFYFPFRPVQDCSPMITNAAYDPHTSSQECPTPVPDMGILTEPQVRTVLGFPQTHKRQPSTPARTVRTAMSPPATTQVAPSKSYPVRYCQCRQTLLLQSGH